MVLKSFDSDIVKLVKNYNTLNVVTGEQISEIEDYISILNTLKDTNTLTTDSMNGLYKRVESLNSDSLTYYFQSVAEGAENARVNIVDAYAAILDGNTHGLKNVQSVMNTFNKSFDGSVEKQQEFAKAVGQSNQSLGKYLSSIKEGGTASLKGYAGQLVVATAKTIGLQLATVALQAAISVGLSLAIMGLTTVISEAVVTQKELREAANESAEKLDNQVEAIKNLKTEYLTIIDSDKTSIEKTEELNTWKQTLVDTYGDEYEALQTLNEERERGVEILDAEIQKTARAARDEWIGTNDEEIDDAVKKYYDVDSRIGSIQGKYMSTTIDIPKSVQELLNIDYQHTHGATYFNFGIDAENIEEQYDKIGQAIEILSNKKQRLGELNEYEQQLLDLLNKKYSKLDKTIEENSPTYDRYFKSVAQNKFEDYVATADGDIENVGKDTYLAWKNGLLKTAENNSKGVQDELTALIEQQFPDYEKYFDNLEKAREQFGVTAPNSADEAKKRAFLEKLSPEDLEIVVNNIPDLFAEGLEGATKKIEEWKADPNNKIDISFNYATYSKQVDDIVNNVDKVQSALDSLNSGKSLDAKDITELANAFPSYSTKILSAANDTEKLKSVLSGIKRDAPQDLINTLTNLKGLSQEDQTAVNGLISVLSQLNSVTSAYTNTLSDLDTKESLLSSTYKEMHDDGEISLGTYQKLLSLGEDYADLVSIVDGKMTVNIQSLKELTQKKYEDEIATLKLTKAELEHNIAIDPKNANTYYEKIRAIEEDIKAKKYALGLFNSYDYTEDGKETKPDSVTTFEKELARRQHEINMGRMSEDEDYYNWLESAAKTAYEGLADYEDDLWKYEEEVYKGRKKLAEDYYNNLITDLESQVDITLETSTSDDGTKLNTKEKFAYVKSIYQEILNLIEEQINNLIQEGVDGNSDAIKQLEKQYQEYAKKLENVFEDEINSEIDYIKTLQENYNDMIDGRIDFINKEKEAVEEKYDTEIKKIDETIDALQKKNDEDQLALDLAKAQQELEKSKQRTRKVYGADGSVTYSQDTEAIAEAEQNLADINLKKTVNDLENQKEALENKKDTEVEKYDEMITALETQQKNQESYYDALLKILDAYLNPNTTESIDTVWEKILSDTENVKVNDGSVEVKGTTVDTTSVTNGKMGTDDVRLGSDEAIINLLKNMGASQATIDKFLKGEMDSALMSLFNNSANSNQFSTQHDSNKWSRGIDDFKIANGKTENVIMNIGDIVVNKPVGNSSDLAKELMMNLPNAFQNQMYTNLKK